MTLTYRLLFVLIYLYEFIVEIFAVESSQNATDGRGAVGTGLYSIAQV